MLSRAPDLFFFIYISMYTTQYMLNRGLSQNYLVKTKRMRMKVNPKMTVKKRTTIIILNATKIE